MLAHDLLALARLAGGHPKEGGFLLFVCYLDDSDDDQASVATLAGYVARFEDWEKYEIHATEVYARYGVDILTAKMMHHTKGCFKGWTQIKINAFIDELMSGVPLTFGVGASIPKQRFNEVRLESPLNGNFSKLGVAMMAIIHKLVRGNLISEYIRNEGLSFVVESGHRNNGDIEKVFHFSKNEPIFKGFLRGLQISGKESSKALHLADVLAFYLRRNDARSFNRKIIVPEVAMLSRLKTYVPHLNMLPLLDWKYNPDPFAGDVKW